MRGKLGARILAVLLAFAMVPVQVPNVVYADNVEGQDVNTSQDTVTYSKIVLGEKEYTLAEMKELLAKEDTDLSQIAYVDETPISLGDFKTMIQIEDDLDQIEETLIPERTFSEEEANQMNQLLAQLQTSGIQMKSGQTTAPDCSWNVNMTGALKNDNVYMSNLYYFPEAYMRGQCPVRFKYRVNEALLSDSITDLSVGIYTNLHTTTPKEVARGVLQADGSYLVEYTSDENPLGSFPFNLGIQITTNGSAPAYAYGNVVAGISFFDTEGISFYDGAAYQNHYTYLFKPAKVSTNTLSLDTTIQGDSGFTYSYSGSSQSLSFYWAMAGTDSSSGFAPKDDIKNLNKLVDAMQSIKGVTNNDDVVRYTGNIQLSQTNDANASSKSALVTLTPADLNNSLVVKDATLPAMDANQDYEFTFTAACKKGAETTYINPQYVPNTCTLGTAFSSKVGNATGITKGYQISLNDDGDQPIVAFSVPEGTYYSGECIPITMTFNELAKVSDGATITINGKEYGKDQLNMNEAGKYIVAWYPVQDADNTQLVITDTTGITDVFGNEVENFTAYTASGVKLESVLMDNAVQGFLSQFDNNKIVCGLVANQEEAYVTKYVNYDDSTENRQAPFRVRLLNRERKEVAVVPVYTVPDEKDAKKVAFSVEEYDVELTSSEQFFYTELQYNAGTLAAPSWKTASIFTGHVNVPKKVSVTGVSIKADMEETEFTLADTQLPKLEYTISPEDASYQTGSWSSSDEKIATIDENGQITLSGQAIGDVTFTYTADNGTDYTGDDKKATYKIHVEAGDVPALVIPDTASTIRVMSGKNATVLWSGNASYFSEDDFEYSVDVYSGNVAANLFKSITPVYSVKVPKTQSSVEIPSENLTNVSLFAAEKGDYNPAYTVRVSMPHPLLSTESIEAVSYIAVLPKPVVAKLTAPENSYLTDAQTGLDIPWKVENATADTSVTMSISNVTGDSSSRVVANETLSGSEGTFHMDIEKLAANALKETYQITLTASTPGDLSSSADSFPLYVYNKNALQIEVAGNKVDTYALQNVDKVKNGVSTDTEDILKLREELGLIAYIGVNYDDYAWSSFSDGIKWITDHDEYVAVNYRQGGLYENIKNFTYSSYLPSTKLAISSTTNGKATITATHANTGMKDSVEVNVHTLKDEFYMFQVTPAAKTSLTYTDGSGKVKTAETNEDGVLGLYEPNGIASDVYLRSEVKDDVYLGTIYQENLQSGEKDATKLQLYPLNTFTLRPVSKATVYMTTEDGKPYSGKVNVRGGVYKNEAYCKQAQIGPASNQLKAGNEDQTFTVSEDGKLTIYMDNTQFWVNSNTEGLTAKDNIAYVFEISKINDDAYYPLLVTVDGNTGIEENKRNGSSVLSLDSVKSGDAEKPFLAKQTISYAKNSEVNVRESVGKIGPNSNFKDTKLISTMLIWGEADVATKDYTVEIADANAFVPKAQKSEITTYPFSSIPVVTNTLTLTKDSMTNSGWIKKETPMGLKLRLNTQKAMLQEKALPFQVVDLTDVPPVDTSASAVLLEMQRGFGFKGLTADIGGDNALIKLISGDYAGMIGDLEESSLPIFRIIVTPSDENTVFDALVWAGYNSTNVSDFDYGQDGVAVNANFLTQDLSVGVPGIGDINDMAHKSYDAEKTMNDNKAAGKQKSLDIGAQLEGYYKGQFYYNSEKSEWEFRTMGGGFTAGVSVDFETSLNTMVGPVPVTATFGAGATFQLDFKAATVYKADGDTTYWTAAAMEDNYVTDTLTTLRLNGYVSAFGGIGVDYSVVALKVGLFGGINIDSTNRFLSRGYLNDSAEGLQAAKKQLNGQGLGVKGEVGIKFVAKLLIFSYEYVLASGDVTVTKTFNNWKYIDDYWNGSVASDLSVYNDISADQSAPMKVVNASATLQSREYLEEYARSWGNSAKRAKLLKAAPAAGNTSMLLTNANPLSYPVMSDDGALMSYISDENSPSISVNSVYVSNQNAGTFDEGNKIAQPADFTGYGDSAVSIAGDQNFAAAAFVRMSTAFEKEAGDSITLEEQNLMMNGTEVIGSIYNGTEWVSTRLSDNGSADLAPVVACNGSKATVFWRMVYSSDMKNVLDFDAEDAIVCKTYENGSWSDIKMVYNGASGSVKGMNASMLPNGTAIVTYTLDRNSKDGKTDDYEIAYSVVDQTQVLPAMIVTNDRFTDENPQVVNAQFGEGDNRFVVGWYSDSEDGTIRLAAVDQDGMLSNYFPESIAVAKNASGEVVGSNFRFAKMDQESVDHLTILWTETETKEDVVDHSIIKGVKLNKEGDTYYFSGAQKLVTLPERTLADHFDAVVHGDSIHYLIQGTWYDPDQSELVNGVSVAKDRTDLLTASSQFVENMLSVDSIAVDYENLALDAYTPVQFTVRNTGTKKLNNITVKVGENTVTKAGALLPNESDVITVNYKVGEKVINPSYSIEAQDTGVLAADTVYLDYNDVGIADMQLVSEQDGKRTVRLILYNAAAAQLANSGRSVKLGLYEDNNYETIAAVDVESMDGVVVNSDHTISITNDALKRMDEGALTIVVTYDLAERLKRMKEEEVPAAGIYLYANATVNETVDGQLTAMPELTNANNKAAILLTGAYARSGEIATLEVTQDNSGNATKAEVLLTNNSMQKRNDKGAVLATLLDEKEQVLETKTVFMNSELLPEQQKSESVQFTKLGDHIALSYGVADGGMGMSKISVNGFGVTLQDFVKQKDGTYLCELGQIEQTDIVISGFCQDLSGKFTIDGTEFIGTGSKTVKVNAGINLYKIQAGGAEYVLRVLKEKKDCVHQYEKTYKNNADEHWKECLNCGGKTEVAAHTFDGGKITKDATETAEGEKTFTCTVCGWTKVETIAKLEKNKTEEPKDEPKVEEPKKGSVVFDDKTGAKVKVLNPETKEVAFISLKDMKKKTLKVPAKVVVQGVTYQVVQIDNGAFKKNKVVTKISLPATIRIIGKDAFNGCSKLKTISIPKNVTEIGANAFKGCALITKITIPKKVTSIGANAFNGCKKLKTITVKTTKLTDKKVGKNAFKSTAKNATMKVPKKQLKTYQKFMKKKGFKGKIKA